MHSVVLSDLCCSQTTLAKAGSGRGAAQPQQNPEQQQPTPHVGGHQEILFDVLATVPSQLRGEFGMSEEIADLIRTSLDRMNQHAGQLVYDLVGNAADRAGDGGFPFPQSLGDG